MRARRNYSVGYIYIYVYIYIYPGLNEKIVKTLMREAHALAEFKFNSC